SQDNNIPKVDETQSIATNLNVSDYYIQIRDLYTSNLCYFPEFNASIPLKFVYIPVHDIVKDFNTIDTLTGFKWLENISHQLLNDKKYVLFGFEEENIPIYRSERSVSEILVQYSNKIKSNLDVDEVYICSKICVNYHITGVRDDNILF
ncbi:unnamed protein product, partial [Rotaria sordida]